MTLMNVGQGMQWDKYGERWEWSGVHLGVMNAQTCVAYSSIEAEHQATTLEACKLIWIIHLIKHKFLHVFIYKIGL